MYFTYKNISLFYEEMGTGKKTILILPGWGDTRSTFRNIISYLAKEYTVICIDYPGFGKSSFPNYSMTIYDYALLIKAFIEELELNDPIIIAHSFGGRIATLLTGYYHMTISRMVLMDIAGIKPKKTVCRRIKSLIYKTLKKAQYLIPSKYKKRYLEKLSNLFGSTDYNNLPNCMKTTFSNIVQEDLKYYVKDIKSECLLLWGENDDATPLQDGYFFQDNIKDSALIVFAGRSHFAYLEEPWQTINIIMTFIEDDV